MLPALIIFLLTYLLMLVLPQYRPFAALGGAALFLALGAAGLWDFTLMDAARAVDFNVLLMMAGMMGTVFLFIQSKMPARLAEELIAHVPDVRWAVSVLALLAGFISAFVDNVATVLMIAPVALAIAKKFKISPVAMVIAISVSSNLQGAATLVGDTTSILLGGYARMDFIDFFVFRGKPGMFWIVECGALLTMLVLLWLFRKETQPTSAAEHTKVTDYLPTVLLSGTIVLLIAASFIPGKPSVTNGLICLSLFAVGLVVNCIKTHSLSELKKPLMDIDFTTLLLLMGLFVVIGGITQAGVIDAIAALFTKIGGGSLFLIYTLIVWASVLFSAFIDNIPYVATMLPVVQGIAASMGVEPYLLYFGLLTGATLGGNLTPIGASANITAIGILRRDGYEVKTSDFMRIGVPFSLTAVVSGYVLLWIFWH